jgi:protein SCO1/2
VNPTRRPLVRILGLLAAGLLLAACGGAAGSTAPHSQFQGTELPAGTHRPEFVLHDTAGRPFDFAKETAGITTLLFFGYTSCPDICPVHLATIAAALQTEELMLPPVKVVMVTVDPTRDTPEVLRKYLDKFDPSFIGLTGTIDEVAAAQESAGLPVAVPEVDGKGKLTGVVGHAAQVTGIGADDVQHVAWPFGTRSSVYAHDIAQLGKLLPSPSTPITTAP